MSNATRLYPHKWVYTPTHQAGFCDHCSVVQTHAGGSRSECPVLLRRALDEAYLRLSKAEDDE